MRPSALVPVIFGLAAFILSMLCIFAGSKKGFMEDYAIVTLNTSRIGQNVLNDTASSSSNPVSSWFKNLTNSIESDINDDIGSLARSLGLHDFYSAHLLDYCEGYFTPGSVPNATLHLDDINKNTTSCSNRTAFFHFNPTTTLQRELNSSGIDVNLDDLNWPAALNKGISALRIAQKAAFLLYCIAAGLLAVATLAALISVFLNGRLSAFIDVLIWLLAFLASLLASALTTAVALKASHVVNKHGDVVGISAKKGEKFLIITWISTGLAFLGVMIWMVECVVGRHRRGRSSMNGIAHGK